MNKNADQFAEPKRTIKFPLWTIISSIILALIVGASFLIPQFLDQAKYKNLIQTKIKEVTGYTVDWQGDIGLRILPLPTASMQSVTVSLDSYKILSVETAEVRVALAPLFNKNVEVKSVTLEKPIINLVTDAAGNNLWTVVKSVKVQPVEIVSNDNKSSPSEFKIEKLSIKDGFVTIDNRQKKTKQSIENINLALQLQSLKGPFDVKGDIVFNKMPIGFDVAVSQIPTAVTPADVKGEIKFPSFGAIATLDQKITLGDVISARGALDLHVKNLNEMLASSGKPVALPKGIGPDLSLKTNLSYSGDQFTAQSLSLKTGVLNYAGSVKVSELSKGGAPLFTLALQSKSADAAKADLIVKILSNLTLNSTARLNDNVLSLQNTQITLDGQSVNLAGSIALPKEKSRTRLNLTVSSPRLDLDDLQKQYVTPSESAAQKASQSTAGETIKLKGFTLPFDGNLKADIGNLTMGARQFSNVALDISAQGNNLTIRQLSLGASAGTALNVKGAISDTNALSGLNLSVNAKSDNVENLVASFGQTMPKLARPLGAVALNGQFNGSLESLNFNATSSVWGFDLTGKGQVNNLNAKPHIQQLDARVRHASTNNAADIFAKGFNVPKSFKGALDLGATIAWDNDQYRLSGINGRAGSTSIQGALTFQTGGKPTLNGSLILGAIELDATKSTKASGGAASTGSSGNNNARWSREAINTDWMRSFNADLAIQAQSLTQGGWRFDTPKFSFALNDGTLSIRDMSASMFGGSASLNAVMKAGASSRDPLNISGNLTANNISAEKLHSAVAGTPKDIFKGTLNKFDLKIDAVGVSPAALVQSLSGQGSLTGNNIIIKGVDASKLAEAARGSFKPLERAGGLFTSFQEGSTRFDTLNAAFGITSGVVNFSEIKFDGVTSSIISKGNLNLPRWTIDLTNTMTVKNTDIPPFDFKISGSLDSPLQTGGSIIENYLRDRAMKKVEKLIGNELEKRLGSELGGALGGVLGIQKKEQPAAPVTVPAETTEPKPVAPAPAPVEPAPTTPPATPEEAIGNIIKDPNNIKTDDAVKALEGLFGQ